MIDRHNVLLPQKIRRTYKKKKKKCLVINVIEILVPLRLCSKAFVSEDIKSSLDEEASTFRLGRTDAFSASTSS